MKFFADTADLDAIKDAAAYGMLDGVTTNPSLMAKVGVSADKADEHYKAICEIVDGDVSAEVIATDYEGILKEGRHLASLHPQIVVKVPMIADGLKAIKTFTEEGIRTNCTLIFSPLQALAAAKAGASYVSPFAGRIDDIAGDGMEVIAQIRIIFDNYGFDTEILGASLRHIHHLVTAAELGVDVVTVPPKLITQMLKHPLTDKGLEQFLADHKKANS